MKVKTKKVYYCEFCNKHNLSVSAITNHEKHCTLNPDRKCGVCGGNGVNKDDIKFLKNNHDILLSWKGKDGANEGILGTHIGEFNDKVKELMSRINCPACMLAIIRQSRIKEFPVEFNFEEEMKDYWKRKNEEEDFY